MLPITPTEALLSTGAAETITAQRPYSILRRKFWLPMTAVCWSPPLSCKHCSDTWLLLTALYKNLSLHRTTQLLPSSPPHSQPDKEARPSRSGGKEEGGWRAWACCLPRRGHGSSGGAGLAADGPKARALRSWRAWGGNRSGLNEQLFPLLPCTTLLWLLFLCSVRET